MKKESLEFRFAEAFPGANTTLLQVKVSEELYLALEAEAQMRNESVPDMVRDFLSFHLIPPLLKSKMEKGLDEKDKNTIESFRKYLSDLETMSKGLAAVKKKLKVLKEQDAWLSRVTDQALEKVLEQMKEQKKLKGT
jgi:hypothetical protein